MLEPLARAFQASYPDVRIKIFVTDRYVDHIAEGIDLVFRIGAGAEKDSSLVAKKIMTYRHRLLASPAYIEKLKPPENPRDLPDHRLLAFAYLNTENSWTFYHVNGKDRETLSFSPHLSMNDFAGLASALVAGGGIGDLPPVVQPELVRDGRLVEVMPDWHFRSYDLLMVHLGNRHVTRTLRVFKDPDGTDALSQPTELKTENNAKISKARSRPSGSDGDNFAIWIALKGPDASGVVTVGGRFN